MLLPFCLNCGGILGEIRSSQNIVGKPILEVVEGQESQGLVSSDLAKPIKIRFKDEADHSITEEALNVTLREGSVGHEFSTDLKTDANGFAQVQVRFGHTPEKIVLEVVSKRLSASTLVTVYATSSIVNVSGLSTDACAAEGKLIGVAKLKVLGPGEVFMANTKVRVDIANGRVQDQPFESSWIAHTDAQGDLEVSIYGGSVSDGYDSDVVVTVTTPDIAGSFPKTLKYEVTKEKYIEPLSPPIQYGGTYTYAQFTFAVKILKECHQPLANVPVSFEWRHSGPGVCEWKASNSTNWELKATPSTDVNGAAQWSSQLNTSPPGGWPNPLWNEVRATAAGGLSPITFVATSIWCDPSTHD